MFQDCNHLMAGIYQLGRHMMTQMYARLLEPSPYQLLQCYTVIFLSFWQIARLWILLTNTINNK